MKVLATISSLVDSHRDKMLFHLAALLVLLLFTPLAEGQTLRFVTSIGTSFDMVLNPSDNSDLQPHVDNMLANVAAGNYHDVVINRADSGFALQLGSFVADSDLTSEFPLNGFASSNTFDPVIVDADNNRIVDFNTDNLSNQVGTVSLALQDRQPNSGTNSFFINLGDNSTLDFQGFVPFATIPDLAPVNEIMALQTIDATVPLNLPPDTVPYTDIPLTADGNFLLLESVSVISGEAFSYKPGLLTAFNTGIQDATATSRANAAAGIVPGQDEDPFSLATALDPALTVGSDISSEFIPDTSLALATSSGSAGVPEPSALVIGLMGCLFFRPQRASR